MALGPLVSIVPPGAGVPEELLWAHADPTDTRYLIVCGMMQDPANNLMAGFVYTSSDAGATWRRTLLDNSTKFVSETSCTYGPNGNAYYADGASDYYGGEPHHETGHARVYVSHDHGLTWTHTWTRKDGWLDWTYLAPPPVEAPSQVAILANSGTDRLGHWDPLRPVAVASTNAGKSFSDLIVPPPSTFHYDSTWIGDAVTLKDGTSLWSTTTSRTRGTPEASPWWMLQNAVEIFAYDPNRRALVSRATVRRLRNAAVFTAALAADRSGGRYNGRLYSAWVEKGRRGGPTALWLSTSDDSGYHWKSRSVLQGSGTNFLAACDIDPPIDEAHVAVSPDGTLGLSWIQNGDALELSLSRDAGRTFSAPMTIARADTSKLYPTEGVTWDDFWLDTVISMSTGKPNPQSVWAKVLGLGIVMKPTVMDGGYIVADGNGAFHSFWHGPIGGRQGLLTRASYANAIRSTGRNLENTAPTGCASKSAFALAKPALPHPLPVIAVNEGTDITSSVRLDPIRYRYDSVAHRASMTFLIVNASSQTLHPAKLIGVGAHSDFGTIHALNASGVLDGRPFWTVAAAAGNGIAPGARSRPITVAVQIDGFHPLVSNYMEGDAFAMAVRVFQNAR